MKVRFGIKVLIIINVVEGVIGRDIFIENFIEVCYVFFLFFV